MTGRPLNDAQISAALRAHFSGNAPDGLRQRISAAVLATPQARRLPWFLGLGDADQIVRRRAALLLVAAALLVSISVAAFVGALFESQQRDVDLTRGSEVDAFVLASYQRVATVLPALRLVLRDSQDAFDKVYFYDGGGRLRVEYASRVTVLTDDFTASQERLETGDVWVVSAGAAGQATGGLVPTEGLVRALWSGPTDCATGWESVETVVRVGRTTNHVRCMPGGATVGASENHLWIDLETGLPLRAARQDYAPNEHGSPFPMSLVYLEVVELEVGPQASGLFVVDPRMSQEEFDCATTGVCPSAGPTVTVAPGSGPPADPVVTPPPAPGPAVAPTDIDAFVAAVHEAYEGDEPVEIIVAPGLGGRGDPSPALRWLHDGQGGYRAGPFLVAGGHMYESDPGGGHLWRDWGAWTGPLRAPTFGLPTGCGIGWKYLGDDLVLDRPAAHLVCGLREFWIDLEWMLVTRAYDHDPLLGDEPGAGLSQITSVTFGPLPVDLFEAPPPDEVWR